MGICKLENTQIQQNHQYDYIILCIFKLALTLAMLMSNSTNSLVINWSSPLPIFPSSINVCHTMDNASNCVLSGLAFNVLIAASKVS